MGGGITASKKATLFCRDTQKLQIIANVASFPRTFAQDQFYCYCSLVYKGDFTATLL